MATGLMESIGAPSMGQQVASGPDPAVYNHFKNLFNAYAGSPSRQQAVIAEYYNYMSPMAQAAREQEERKRLQEEQRMQMFFGGGLSNAGGGGQQLQTQQSEPSLPFMNELRASNVGNRIESDINAPAGRVSGLSRASNPALPNINQQEAFDTNLMNNVAEPPGAPQAVSTQNNDNWFLNAAGNVIGGLTAPFREGIINPIAAIGQTAVGTIGDLAEGKTLQEALANPENAIQNQKPFLVSEEENRQYMENPALGGVKGGAGILSYAVPGNAKTIAGAVTRGAVSGGLGGFGTSDLGNEVGGATQGALLGGGLGGGLKVAGNMVNRLRGAAGAADDVTRGVGAADDTFDDILNNPNISKTGAGLSRSSTKPFNQALNDLTSTIDDASSAASRQKLQAFADRAAKAADQGIADADEVLGALNSIYGVKPTTSAAGATNLMDTLDEVGSARERLVDTFIDNADIPTDKFGRPVLEGNPLQRIGQRADFENLNFKATPGSNMYDELVESQVAHNRAAKALGVNLDQKGLQTIQSETMKARDTLIKNAGAPGKMGPELTDEMVNTFGETFGFTGSFKKTDQVKNALKNFISDNLSEETLAKAGYGKVTPTELSEALLSGNVRINPQLAQALRDKVGKMAVRAKNKIYGTTTSPLTSAEEIAYSIDEPLKKMLFEQVPGYRNANSILASEASRAYDLAAGMNAGNQVSNRGRISIQDFLARKGLDALGTVSNISGDIIAGESPRIGLPGVSGLTGKVNLQGAGRTAGEVLDGAIGAGLANPGVTYQVAEGLGDTAFNSQGSVTNQAGPGNIMGTSIQASGLSNMGEPSTITQQPTQMNGLSGLQAAYMFLGPDASPSELLSAAKYFDEKNAPAETNADLTQLNNAVAEMKRLYGAGTDQSLSQGGTTVGLTGVLGRLGQDIRKGTDQDYVNRLQEYKQMTALAAGILNQARGAGTLNAGEFEVMMSNMPNEYSSEEQATAWFDNVLQLLSKK